MLTPIEMMRRKKGYRQTDMEEFTKIPQPRFSRIERGVTEATPAEMEAIKKVLLSDESK